MGVAAGAARAASPTGLSPASGSSQSGIANAGRQTLHLRLDRDLHDRIGKSSKRHGRTMTAEIIARLERLYRPENNNGTATL